MAKNDLPSDEELKLEIKRKILEIMRRPPNREKRYSVPCKYSPAAGSGKELKHQVNILIPDDAAALTAAKELWDRIEGKAATKKEAPKVKTSGRSLEELTDEELEALVTGGTDGTSDGEAAEEAAG